VLTDAQIAPKVRPSLSSELAAYLEDPEHAVWLRDVRAFFEGFLGNQKPGMLIAREQLPPEISFYAPEGRQEIRPSFAIARGPFSAQEDDPFAQFDAPGDDELTEIQALKWLIDNKELWRNFSVPALVKKDIERIIERNQARAS
jgi:hypothetical protein